MKTSSCFSARWFVNQLSVFGAVADQCKELSEDSWANETWSTWSFGNAGNSYWHLCCRNSYQRTATGKPGARSRPKTRTIVRWLEIIKIMLWCWFEACEIGQYFFTLDTEEAQRCNIFAENTKCVDTRGRLERKDGFSRIRRSAQSSKEKFAIMMVDTVSNLGYSRERNCQVRYRIDANHGRTAYSFWDTHCQSKTTTETRSDADFGFYSCSWPKMDGRWNRTNTCSTVLCSVKSHI